MAQAASFTIGSNVSCGDGSAGTLKRVVIDPVARAVTHLVVEPKHRQGLGRLVPVALAEAAGAGNGVRLRCSLAEFERLDWAEDTQFVPGTQGYAAYGSEQVLAWPYYAVNGGQDAVSGVALAGVSQVITYDTVPAGEVEVRRGEPVLATDGHIGHVHGLAVDPASHRVSHVLLAEGHLWGHKEVAIPISAVTDVHDGIKLRLTKHEVAALPPVQVDR